MILIEAVAALISIGWSMLISVKFPGSNMPIAAILIGAFVIFFGIRIFAFVMGMSVNVGPEIREAKRASRKKGA